MTDIKNLFEKTKENKPPEFQAKVDEILQEYESTKAAIDKLYGSADFASDYASSISNLAIGVEEINVEEEAIVSDAPVGETNAGDAVKKSGGEIEVDSAGAVIRVAGLTADDAEILNEHRALEKMTILLQDTCIDLERKTRFVAGEKIYPNEPCPCGSGKKYKKCCGRKELTWEERKELIALPITPRREFTEETQTMTDRESPIRKNQRE